jgi:arylsulfatase A-like enzyme
VYGPESSKARDFYKQTDALVSELIHPLLDDWGDILLIIVSDHGMEPVSNTTPINLLSDSHSRDLIQDLVNEGGCSMVRLRSGVRLAEFTSKIDSLPGVAGWRESGADFFFLEAEPGRVFGDQEIVLHRGTHGGRGTTRPVTIVSGGHPVVKTIASTIQAQPPHLADWAPTIAYLLGLSPYETDGHNLAAI